MEILVRQKVAVKLLIW